MIDNLLIHEKDIITSERPPAGIVIPDALFEMYETIKAAESGRGLQGVYVTGQMFEELKAGKHPAHIQMGLCYPELSEKLGYALTAKFAKASSYSDIKDFDEQRSAVEYWVAAQHYPFALEMRDMRYAPMATKAAQLSGIYEAQDTIQKVDFTVSATMPPVADIMRAHSFRPTSAIIYDFDAARFHYHRETEKNLYQRNDSGFTPRVLTAVERGAAMGLRLVK